MVFEALTRPLVAKLSVWETLYCRLLADKGRETRYDLSQNRDVVSSAVKLGEIHFLIIITVVAD